MNRNSTSDIIQIHGVTHDGKGVATVNQKKILIESALLNEKVTYAITRKKRHFSEATVTEVIEASPERVDPPCTHFGLCGGCSVQHMNMRAQLQFKEETLLQQLKHFGKVIPLNRLPPLDGPSLKYRRKARLGVRYVIKKNKLLVGFRERASNYLAELTHCEVLHDRIGTKLTDLAALITTLEAYQDIPQIEVAIGDEQVALVFRHLKPLSEADLTRLTDFCAQQQFHLYLQSGGPESVSKHWPADQIERLSYTLPDYKLEFLFHPLDFTQINLDINRLMVKQAIEELAIQPTDQVLDLFCGIGNFSLPMARSASHVHGVEGSSQMVERAYENAQHNQIKNVSFQAVNLEDIDQDHPLLKKTYDKILLDPPRVGAKTVLNYLMHFNAKRIVYISCNPATLARDAEKIVHELGYTLTKTGIINMFPHTSHIEAMAVFDKVTS